MRGPDMNSRSCFDGLINRATFHAELIGPPGRLMVNAVAAVWAEPTDHLGSTGCGPGPVFGGTFGDLEAVTGHNQ